MSTKQKSTKELRDMIAKLQGTLELQERVEREKIGAEMQKLTGLESWSEIEPVIRSALEKKA